MPNSKLRKKTILVFFVIVPLILGLIVGEIYIRLFYDYKTPEILKQESLQYSPSIFSHLAFPEKRQSTKVNGKIPSYIINSKGYRGEEFPEKKHNGTIRILIYGGSSVFDIYMPEGNDWPHLVEKHLNVKGISNVEVINAGIPGLTSFDSMGRFFSDGWTLHPDYVINYEAWNDICYFTNKITIQKYYKPFIQDEDPRVSYRSGLDKFFCESSQLYVRLRAKYYNWKYKIGVEGAAKATMSDEEINDLAVKQYQLSLEMFVDMARNIQSVPILVKQARLVNANNTPEQKLKIGYKYQKMNHSNLVKAFNITDSIIDKVAETKKVNVIDPSAIMSGNSAYFRDHVHTSKEGSEKLARIISENLFNIIYIIKNK